MSSVPAQPEERISTDEAPASVATSASAKVLDGGVHSAFTPLQITPGNWLALLALPFLEAAHRLSVRSRGVFGCITFSSSPWPRSPHDWNALFTGFDGWINDKASQHLHVRGCEFREKEIVGLHESLFPKGKQPDRDKYEKANSLLCWHLAKNYDALGRRKVLGSLSTGDHLLDRTDDAKNFLKEITDGLAPLIDEFLAIPTFAELTGRRSELPEVAKTPTTPFEDVGCLVIIPFAVLLDGNRLQGSELGDVIRKLLNQPVPGGEIQRFLEPSWARLLRHLLGPSSNGVPDTKASDASDSYQHELVVWLARLPFKQREQLLGELRHLILSLRHEHYSMSDYSPKRVEDYFTQLRYGIENARQQPKAVAIETVIVNPIPLTQENATPHTAVQIDREKRAVQNPIPICPPADESSRSPAAPPIKVLDASPFKTVSWQEVCKRNSSPDMARIVKQLLSTPMLFGGGEGSSVARPREGDVPQCLWFVGDLHGDPLALENAWDFVSELSAKEGQPPHVLFLGDFVDRGLYSHETLLSLFRLIVDNPGRIGVVVGNHDENFKWDKDAKVFLSGIEPAEYTAELNKRLSMSDDESQFRVKIGKIAGALFERCTRAIFMPDGMLVAHAGFPHTDLHESLKSFDDLKSQACLQDFVWLRASPNSRKKLPNRGSRGCDFGYEDFARFCEHMTKLGQPVRRMIRGHDHIPERYIQYPRYATHPVVTINTMCRKLEDEVMSEQFPKACVARYVKDELPIIYRMPIERREIEAAFFAGREGN